MLLQTPLRMFGPVVLDELGVVLLLLPDLDTEKKHSLWIHRPLKTVPYRFHWLPPAGLYLQFSLIIWIYSALGSAPLPALAASGPLPAAR